MSWRKIPLDSSNDLKFALALNCQRKHISNLQKRVDRWYKCFIRGGLKPIFVERYYLGVPTCFVCRY